MSSSNTLEWVYNSIYSVGRADACILAVHGALLGVYVLCTAVASAIPKRPSQNCMHTHSCSSRYLNRQYTTKLISRGRQCERLPFIEEEVE